MTDKAKIIKQKIVIHLVAIIILIAFISIL